MLTERLQLLSRLSPGKRYAGLIWDRMVFLGSRSRAAKLPVCGRVPKGFLLLEGVYPKRAAEHSCAGHLDWLWRHKNHKGKGFTDSVVSESHGGH